MFISLTYAIQLGKHSIGVSPVFVYQTFEATGLQAFRDMGMAGTEIRGPGTRAHEPRGVVARGIGPSVGREEPGGSKTPRSGECDGASGDGQQLPWRDDARQA